MKKVITLLTALLMTLSSFAQQGINYKAILKDTNGNVLASTFMNVQFTIHQSSATGTIVYQEDHNYTTDANGMLILNIGTDNNPSIGVFNDIDWAADLHFLQVTITYSGGTVNFDATQFMAVPYAKHAKTAENVSGLEALDEGNGKGWRLIGRDPSNYGPIGQDAVDLSYSDSNATPVGATGDYSTAMGYRTTAYDTSTAMGASTTASGFISTAMGFGTTASGDTSTAMGQNTTASGYVSTAMGLNTTASGGRSTAMGSFTTASGDTSTAMGAITTASGQYSTAMGQSTTASGGRSTAMGYATTASGNHSTAMGYLTTAGSAFETAIGRYTTNETPLDTLNWNANDRLFVIGNGTSTSQRSNALTVLKNGTITAPSFDLAEITDDKALVTKEYVDTNLPNAPSGLRQATWTENTGWKLIGATQSGFIGSRAIDMSTTSLALAGARGDYSFAVGSSTDAKGDYSVAMGQGTIATANHSTAIGTFNSSEPDGLFIIGNGTSSVNRNNALIVRDNGDAQFDGKIQHTSTGSANMIPIAYGTIDSAGTVLSGTGNFSVKIEPASPTTFLIDVPGETLSHTNSSTLVTPLAGVFRTASITHLNGDVRVYIFNSSGTQVTNTFQFVIYRL